MSLIGTLNLSKTALSVQQAAIQTTGNNIANAGNADYTRQTASLKPNRDQQVGPRVFLGQGVNLDNVRRQIDEALQGRLRGSFADAESADTLQQWLGRIEATFNELSEDDLSTRLSTYFAASRPGGPWPIPMRRRGNICEPSWATTDFMPLCVPELPRSRSRRTPNGRSRSS